MNNFKNKLKANYTQISNSILNDDDLSLKAKGLLVYLISKDDNWNFSAKGIKSQNNEGLSSINSGLKELEKFNYLLRNKIKDENGKFTGIEYIIQDRYSDNSKTDNGKPVYGFSENGKTDNGKSTNISNTISSNTILSNNIISNNIDTNVSFPEKFIELYNLYSGSKKDLETEYNNWIEKCEWNVDYDFLISKLKKTDKQHFQSWLNKFRTEPSKFRKIIIEEYLKFHEEKTSFKLSLKAYQINSCENISKYIESAVKLKSNSLGRVIDNIEQDVRDSIVFIFSNWNLLNDFYRSQISIEQIDKNFSNIVQQIKQGYAKQQQSESDPKIGRTRLSSLEKLRQQMLNQ